MRLVLYTNLAKRRGIGEVTVLSLAIVGETVRFATVSEMIHKVFQHHSRRTKTIWSEKTSYPPIVGC